MGGKTSAAVAICQTNSITRLAAGSKETSSMGRKNCLRPMVAWPISINAATAPDPISQKFTRPSRWCRPAA